MPITPIIVVELTETCPAVPDQWEGPTENGRGINIRDRHGSPRVDHGGQTVFALDHGDQFDGVMDYDDLKRLLPAFIHLPNEDLIADDLYPGAGVIAAE